MIMKDYCCQVHSVSGRILETFYENFFDAVHECVQAEHCISSRVYRYPNMKEPICVAKSVR